MVLVGTKVKNKTIYVALGAGLTLNPTTNILAATAFPPVEAQNVINQMDAFFAKNNRPERFTTITIPN